MELACAHFTSLRGKMDELFSGYETPANLVLSKKITVFTLNLVS